MTVAGTAGGAIGGTVGEWGGGILGGALGELFGPEAVVPGAMIGRRLGRWGGQLAGAALAEWLANHMSHADKGADKEREADADASTACAECTETRSKPGQTCDDERLAELQAEKDAIANSIHKLPVIPRIAGSKRREPPACADVRLRLEGMRRLRAARQRIQDECFAGSPDPGHQQAIQELDQGIKNLEQLEAEVCNVQDGPAVS